MKLLFSLLFLTRLLIFTAPTSGGVIEVPDGATVFFRPFQVIWGRGEVESFELFLDNPGDAQDVYIVRRTHDVTFELAPNETIMIIEGTNAKSP